MIYDIRELETHNEWGWTTILQIKRTAHSEWEPVRREKIIEGQTETLPLDDAVRRSP